MRNFFSRKLKKSFKFFFKTGLSLKNDNESCNITFKNLAFIFFWGKINFLRSVPNLLKLEIISSPHLNLLYWFKKKAGLQIWKRVFQKLNKLTSKINISFPKRRSDRGKLVNLRIFCSRSRIGRRDFQFFLTKKTTLIPVTFSPVSFFAFRCYY